MIVKTLGSHCVVRFDPGERYPGDFEALARDRQWRTGQIQGIGGVRDVILAYYDAARQEYLKFGVEGIVELVSLTGNLAQLSGTPVWHCHAAVGDPAGKLKGGHLIELTVALTLECWITLSGEPISRQRDQRTGLNLLNLDSLGQQGDAV